MPAILLLILSCNKDDVLTIEQEAEPVDISLLDVRILGVDTIFSATIDNLTLTSEVKMNEILFSEGITGIWLDALGNSLNIDSTNTTGVFELKLEDLSADWHQISFALENSDKERIKLDSIVLNNSPYVNFKHLAVGQKSTYKLYYLSKDGLDECKEASIVNVDSTATLEVINYDTLNNTYTMRESHENDIVLNSISYNNEFLNIELSNVNPSILCEYVGCSNESFQIKLDEVLEVDLSFEDICSYIHSNDIPSGESLIKINSIKTNNSDYTNPLLYYSNRLNFIQRYILMNEFHEPVSLGSIFDEFGQAIHSWDRIPNL